MIAKTNEGLLGRPNTRHAPRGYARSTHAASTAGWRSVYLREDSDEVRFVSTGYALAFPTIRSSTVFVVPFPSKVLKFAFIGSPG